MSASCKLTQELAQAILKLIEAGTFPTQAARCCGVPKSTWCQWLNSTYTLEDSEANALLVKFREDVETARATARVSAEIRVAQIDPKTWLMRGPGRAKPGDDPSEFWEGDNKQKIELSGNANAPIVTEQHIKPDLKKLTTEELEHMRALVKKATS